MTDTQSARLEASATGVKWDLSDLFAGADDPKINETIDACKKDAEQLANQYRGKINVPGGPAPEVLLAGVQALEAISERASRVGAYAHLLYDTDTRDNTARNLQQRVEQELTQLNNLTLFFELEWMELDAADADRLLAH